MSAEFPERTLIVVPTYNEHLNLSSLVAAVRAAAPQADVLIVDDNSPDGTGQLADELSHANEHVSVLHRPAKLGLGSAYVEGFRHGLERGYTQLFEMDADFSHDPAHLSQFFSALQRGADVVLGSRNIPGGRIEGWGWGRHVLSKGGSLYARAILGLSIRDLTSGFKAFTARALRAIGLDDVRSDGYSFQIEMTYRALRRGLRVVEVPIVFVDRRAGQSKMDAHIFLQAVGIVWQLRMDARRGKL